MTGKGKVSRFRLQAGLKRYIYQLIITDKNSEFALTLFRSFGRIVWQEAFGLYKEIRMFVSVFRTNLPFMKSLFTLLLLVLFSSALSAQTEAITENGRRVLLMPDQTWQYQFQEPVRDFSCEELLNASRTESKVPLVIDDGSGNLPITVALARKGRNGLSISFTAEARPGEKACIDGTHNVVVIRLFGGETYSFTTTAPDNCE